MRKIRNNCVDNHWRVSGIRVLVMKKEDEKEHHENYMVTFLLSMPCLFPICVFISILLHLLYFSFFLFTYNCCYQILIGE